VVLALNPNGRETMKSESLKRITAVLSAPRVGRAIRQFAASRAVKKERVAALAVSVWSHFVEESGRRNRLHIRKVVRSMMGIGAARHTRAFNKVMRRLRRVSPVAA